MFRWLIEQRYLVANPFAGIKVRGSSRSTPMDEGRVFSEGEWAIIRAVANGLEWSYGWKLAAAQWQPSGSPAAALCAGLRVCNGSEVQ